MKDSPQAPRSTGQPETPEVTDYSDSKMIHWLGATLAGNMKNLIRHVEKDELLEAEEIRAILEVSLRNANAIVGLVDWVEEGDTYLTERDSHFS